ncbi:uncharacterized protein LOC143340630 [Colletes latitarsis]|uniref:uncharacterized protein LOC143340630 n=1 Tax=Colletes latitarsis TaxID=2605962 RepID=UPI004035DF0B
MDYISDAWAYIAPVGWYIIAIAISFWYASPYIWEKYRNWKLRKDEQDYAAKYHKNTDLLQERLSALEASRQRMQQNYYQKCMVAREEKECKREQKAQSRLIDINLVGQGLENKSNDWFPVGNDKPKSVKKDYNPLMGDGSRGYRPPKRSRCGNGGCG